MSSTLPVELVTLIREVFQPSGVSPDFTQKQAALSAAQETAEAWNWASIALSEHEHDPYIRFFGAHTIARKIEHGYFAMSNESRAALRVSLLSWLALSCYRSYETNEPSAASERVVMRKLASALATVAVFSKADGEWNEWIKEIVALLSGERFSTRQGLFEVLAECAAEERELPKSKMKNGKKGPVAALAASDLAAIAIENLLLSALVPGHPACSSALKCTSALMAREVLSQEQLSAIYPALPPLLGQEASMELASSIIEDCLIKCTTFSGFMTKPRVDALASDFASSLSAAFLKLPDEDNLDSLPLPLIKLFVTLLEALILDDVQQRLLEPVFQQLLRNLLCLCTSAGRFGADEEMSNLGFPLWLLLQEEAASAGIRRDSPQQAAWQVLHQAFVSLWPALLRKITFGSTEEWQSLPRDVRERFHDYRREAGEVFLSTYWVLRDEMLQQLVQNCLHSQSDDDIEALLFAVSKIAYAALRTSQASEDSLAYDSLFSSYSFGSSNSPFRLTSELEIIGVCSIWLNKHPEHLFRALSHTVQSLQTVTTAHAASKTLQQLCKHCSSHLAQHLDSFAGLIASSYGHLKAEDFASLVGAVGTILEDLRTEAAGRATLVHRLPQVQRSHLTVLQSIGIELIKQLYADVERLATLLPGDRLYGLEAFCAFAKSISHSDVDLYDLDGDETSSMPDPFADVGQSPAILDIRQRIHASLTRLATMAVQSERLADLETLCMALTASSTPTALSLDSLSVLEASTSCASQSLWLLTAGRLVHRVSRDGGLQGQRLQRLTLVNQAICQGALSGPQANDPDAVQALLALQTDMMRCGPAALLQSIDLVNLLLRGAAQALTSPERPTARAAVDFASSLVLQGDDVSRQAFATHCSPLVTAALQRCLQNKEDCILMAELLRPAVHRLPDLTRSSLIEVLRQPEWRMTDHDKNQCLAALMKAHTVKTTTAALENLVASVQS